MEGSLSTPTDVDHQMGREEEEEEKEEEGQGSDEFVDSSMEEDYLQMRFFHLDLIYDLPLFVFTNYCY